MQLAELNSEIAFCLAKQLLEQILAENRCFTPLEREIVRGLMGFTGAAVFGNMNDANSRYEQFEQRQHLVDRVSSLV